jgi:hypothetical protein
MDWFTGEQVWGLSLYIVGSLLLTWCSKMEHAQDVKFRDPRYRMGKRPGEVKRPKTLRGTVLTYIGFTLCVVGSVMFFMNIDMTLKV